MSVRLFGGFDPRFDEGWAVFQQSLAETSPGVTLNPISGPRHDGSTAFTYSRFRVPELCDYRGWAIFVDGSDMILRADIRGLWALRDDRFAVQVVPHSYSTRHPRKYLGTPMESDNRDYECKNWSSVMLLNCSHPVFFAVRAALRGSEPGLQGFGWCPREAIGFLPLSWNWLVDEYGPSADAKLLHWTAGVPGLSPYYAKAPHAEEWFGIQDRKDIRGTQ